MSSENPVHRPVRYGQAGWTIIQTMVALLVAGVAAAVVDILIDKRCEADAARWICARR